MSIIIILPKIVHNSVTKKLYTLSTDIGISSAILIATNVFNRINYKLYNNRNK